MIFVFATVFSTALAQTVTRGPYLQFPTSSSMKVKWRTDAAHTGRVYFGSSVGNVMDNFLDESSSGTDHTVNLTGLNPNTEYYYAISDGTTMLAGADENHRFTTSPTIGTVQPINVWAIGDFGKGNSKQMQVKDAFLNHVGDEMPDFWLFLGDNAYDTGMDSEYSQNVFGETYGYWEIFPRLPFMATPGNHDYFSVVNLAIGADPTTHDGPYYDVVDVPTNGEIGGVASGYELYYSFDYGNVHFMSINSELGSSLNGDWDWTGIDPLGLNPFSTSPLTDWIHADLQANDKPWVVAFTHQPPHTDGSHESDTFYEVYMRAIRENIAPILESYGVDLLITGHSHVYERSYLINGFSGSVGDFDPNIHIVDGSSGKLSEGNPYIKYFDGPNPNLGTLHIVQGNSGSSESDASLQHPAMYFGHGCDTCVGSTMIRAFGDTLSGYYLTGYGEILDEWTIIKKDYSVGVDEADESDSVIELELVPNPFGDKTTCTIEITEKQDLAVQLLDISGKIIHSFFSGKVNEGKQTFVISAAELGLSKGTYFVRIVSDAYPAITRKIIKVE